MTCDMLQLAAPAAWAGPDRFRPVGAASFTSGLVATIRVSGFANKGDEIVSSGSEWYAEYLSSPYWRDLRRRKIDRDGPNCAECGVSGVLFDGLWFNLHVHHLTYERVPHLERLDDLEVLCVWCHKVTHGLIEDPTPEQHELFRRRVGQQIIARFVDHTTYCSDEIDLEIRQWDELAEAAGF